MAAATKRIGCMKRRSVSVTGATGFLGWHIAEACRDAGYRVLFEPRSRVLHRVSASYGTPGRRLLEQQSRNEERVFWRNLPGRVLARALPRHLAVLAAKAWRRWREGALAPFLCGRLRVLGEVAALLRHRRALRPLGGALDVRAWHVEDRYWQRSSFDIVTSAAAQGANDRV